MINNESEVGEVMSVSDGKIQQYGGSPIMRGARTPSGVAKVNSAGEIIDGKNGKNDITQNPEFLKLFGADVANQFREKNDNHKVTIIPGTVNQSD